jgi:cyclopropane-fatty-acyl-phospholipid synthase
MFPPNHGSYNLSTYPYFTALLSELGIETEASDMSFAVCGPNFEWSSLSPANTTHRKRFASLVYEIARFGSVAEEVLRNEGQRDFNDTTIGDYLRMRNFSENFAHDYVLPMLGAIWSVSNVRAMDQPIIPLVAFMKNHYLLSPFTSRPRWRVISNRSETYVQLLERRLRQSGAKIVTGKPVRSVVELEGSGAFVDNSFFDHAILATHATTSREILKQGEIDYRNSPESFRAPKQDAAFVNRFVELLAHVKYQSNDVVLHSDPTLLPKNQALWASWNVLQREDKRSYLNPQSNERDDDDDDDDGEPSVCVSYWLNLLQNLPAESRLLVATLNPIHEPAEGTLISRFVLDHPVFDREGCNAARQINESQARADAAKQRVWLSGAWLGWGFHEDGLRSGIAVATALGARPRYVNVEHPGLEIVHGPSPVMSLSDRVMLGVFTSIGKQIFREGRLRFILPNGEDLIFGDANYDPRYSATVFVKNLNGLKRCMVESDIGLGEAIMYDEFDVDSMVKLMRVLILNRRYYKDVVADAHSNSSVKLSFFNRRVAPAVASTLYYVGRVRQLMLHRSRANTVQNARENIHEHYDLGNEMYKLFLDETMTYSCGLFKPGRTLKDAQLAKLDAIIEKAQLQRGQRVLEIGCGWGSFAIRAASTTGCRVVGVTISEEQLHFALERVQALGLQDLVELVICDYRELGVSRYDAHSFDAVVSIEMIEAVGHQFLPEYFETIDRMLKPASGRAVIQAIGMPDDRYEEYLASSDFIRRHVFPGGHLPCPSVIRNSLRGTSLQVEKCDDIGRHYAETLRLWAQRFNANAQAIEALGYPSSFMNKWRFYFAYCQAGFEADFIYTWQLSFTNYDPASQPERIAPIELELPVEVSAEGPSLEVREDSEPVCALPIVQPYSSWTVAPRRTAQRSRFAGLFYFGATASFALAAFRYLSPKVISSLPNAPLN